MKKYNLFILIFVICIFQFAFVMLSGVEAHAQAPQSFNYQMIARDTAGLVLSNRTLGIQISILKDASNGIVVYSERHTVTTNFYGLVNLGIGTGSGVFGSFQPIDWGTHLHFIKLEIDPSGGTNYFAMGTSQLVSVPYALYAEKAGNAVDTSNSNELQALSISNDTLYLTNGGFVKLPAGLWSQSGNNIYNNNSGNIGIGTNTPSGKLIVKGDSLASANEPLFEVKNKDGDPVFIVYPDSAHFFINSGSGSKGIAIGGFAVSGRSSSKGGITDYLLVNHDSVRVYIDPSGNKGGFGVGNQAHNTNDSMYLFSDKKGFNVTFLTTAERNAIAHPRLSSIIFNTTDSCLQIYLGYWESIWCTPENCIFPNVTSHPVNVSINADSGIAYFGVAAVGSKIHYRWQESNDGGSNWRMTSVGGTNPQYSGTRSDTLVIIDAPDYYYNYKYRCTVSNACGSEISSAASLLVYGIFTDSRDGHLYYTKIMGTQTWMTENMNYGTRIDGSGEQTDNSIPEKYCYDNNESNCTTYGGLYQWAEIVKYINGATNTTGWSPIPTGNVRGICPYGWHIPSESEWTVLIDYLGGGDVAGGKMKEAGTTHWHSPNALADNSSGFTGLPGGNRHNNGVFYSIGYNGSWWSATVFNDSTARSLGLNSDNITTGLGAAPGNKDDGYSVRCIRSFPSAILPTVSTTAISSISGTTAISGGAISSDGGDSITARGVCWGISQNPTTSDGHTTDGTGTGSFTSSLTGLDTNTTYYVRAYATNSEGTDYGNEVSFTTTIAAGFLPTVSTTAASGINQTTATSGGNVTSDGGATVTTRGVCWSTSQNPTTANSTTTNGSGTGVYTSYITGLSAGITYYVRAYATNSVGTSYGSQINFATLDDIIPCDGITSFNYGGQTYQTVEIGLQCWMVENLNIGTMIISTGGGQLQTDNAVIEKYCYNNISDSCNTYGGLYEWREMMQYAPSDGGSPGTTQGICPTGWHLPTDEEWTALTTYLGGAGVAGGKMKEVGLTHWNNPNESAANESGFTALPSGLRDILDDSFDIAGDFGYFWSATENGSSYAWNRDLRYNGAGVYRNINSKEYGFSVRCLKNN